MEALFVGTTPTSIPNRLLWDRGKTMDALVGIMEEFKCHDPQVPAMKCTEEKNNFDIIDSDKIVLLTF
jgi:hypothetical protein